MNRQQKYAWWSLAFYGPSLVGLVAFVIPLVARGGSLGAWTLLAFGVLGTLIVIALIPTLARKSPDIVTIDERDRVIDRKATLGGLLVSFLAFFVTCYALWGVLKAQNKNTISIDVLVWLVWLGIPAFIVGHSITLLVLYGRGVRNDSSGATEG